MDKLVRLYVVHDLDLIALKFIPGFDMAETFRHVLIAYVRNEKYEIPLPPDLIPYSFPYKNTSFHVLLDNKKDADVIEFLDSVRRGLGNSVMKQIFRHYCTFQNILPFLYEFSRVEKINGKSIMTIPGEVHPENIPPAETESEEKAKPAELLTPGEEEIKAESAKKPEPPEPVEPDVQEEDQPFDLFAALDKIID